MTLRGGASGSAPLCPVRFSLQGEAEAPLLLRSGCLGTRVRSWRRTEASILAGLGLRWVVREEEEGEEMPNVGQLGGSSGCFSSEAAPSPRMMSSLWVHTVLMHCPACIISNFSILQRSLTIPSASVAPHDLVRQGPDLTHGSSLKYPLEFPFS